MPIVRKGANGAEALRAEPYESESELEEVLADHVELLREGDEPRCAMVTSQLHLPGSGIADLVFVDAAGVPVLVEVKLGRNPQSRREVIAQVFDYASALSAWTVDELDDHTDGALETALYTFSEDDEAAFRARWRAVAANLRSGMVRVVAAVDEHTDELSRVIEFINDHSDLDVRLLVVEKYRDTSGDLLFSSTTPIITDEQVKAARAGSSARGIPPRDKFVAVLEAYEALDNRPLELHGRARRYRQLRHPDWPGGVHYELFDQTRSVNAEIHLETDEVAPLTPILESLAGRLSEHFPAGECRFEPKWFKGKGRVRVIHEKGVAPEVVAENMVRLIQATVDEIGEAVGNLD